ncbi:GYD domain-containing protein [Roseobacteraceae bacterium NS-SX3]
MATHMVQFRYSAAALQAMVDKPQNRREAAAKIFAAAGGKLEAMYLCFGRYDGVALAEFPSNTDSVAAMLAVASSGAITDVQTTVLISLEDAVKAMEKAKSIKGEYTPPTG